MSARAVLAKASAAGVRIQASNGQLSLRGNERLIAELLPSVKANKPELLLLLAANDPALPPELDRLISKIALAQGFSREQTKEARDIAAGDIENALTSFRDLAQRSNPGIGLPRDDRVLCSGCVNLLRGRCQAAARGLMPDTYRGYSPVPDVPRNCDFYSAKLFGKAS
jgi:hypothetical protein